MSTRERDATRAPAPAGRRPGPRRDARGADGRPRVVLDLVPIHPGQGGTGGGIWSYASHLVRALDASPLDDLELVCLAHPELPLAPRHVRVVRVPVDTRSVARRLAWVHAGLPAWCLRHGVAVLHKLATEIPLALPRTRVLTTVHDFMPEFFREAMPAFPGRRRPSPAYSAYFALATRRCFARSDRVHVLTEAIAAEARRRHPRAAARLATVPHGVLPPPAPAAARRAPADPLRVLYVGTFSPYKGQLNAARAFARLAERSPAAAASATLVFRGFVGDPAYHAAVRDAVARGAGAERVRFVPYERDASPGDIYAGADLLLLLSEYEGFGMPLLEAQAAGVPVLCADLPVFREVLGDSACFVPARDADAVAAALERLLGDAALRAEYARRGAANARRYTWARTARAMIGLYRELATGERRRA